MPLENIIHSGCSTLAGRGTHRELQQRRHAAHQRSGCRAVNPEAQTGGRATSAKQVAGGTKKDKKRRPLEEVLREFQGKVIKAAQELQQQIASSAAKPVLDGSTIAADDDPFLARLKENQRKRATETETQDQRPVAKPKAAKRQSKRTASTVSGSVETPASKRKDRRLTQESFAASAQDPSELVDPGAASSGSGAAQQRCRRVWKVRQELLKLNMESVQEQLLKSEDIDEAARNIQDLIERANFLTRPVLTWSEANEMSMKELYTPRCGIP